MTIAEPLETKPRTLEERTINIWRRGNVGSERWTYFINKTNYTTDGERDYHTYELEARRADVIGKNLPSHYVLSTGRVELPLSYLSSIRDAKEAYNILKKLVQEQIKHFNKGRKKYIIVDESNVDASSKKK